MNEERKILPYVKKNQREGLMPVSTVVTSMGETFQQAEPHRGLQSPRQERCPCCGYTVDETTHGWFKDEITRQPVPCPACSPKVRMTRLRRLIDSKIGDLVKSSLFANRHNLPIWSDELSLSEYPDAGDQSAKKKVQAFIRGDVAHVFLTGDVGRGKTGLAISAVKDLAAQGVQALFLPSKQYFSLLQDTPQIKDIVKAVQVLVLDDLGMDSGCTVEEAGEIIETRLDAGLHTLVTSNFDREGLAAYWHMEKYEGTGFQPVQRLTSRIGGGFVIVRLNGPDLRRG